MEMEGKMRFKITQRLLADSSNLVWVVFDTQTQKIVSKGSWMACANACRELNKSHPQDTRLTQQKIDGSAEHRRGFFAMLSQIRNAVFPSTQIVK